MNARDAVRFRSLVLSCLLVAPAFGADWRLSKGVSTTATFTDNADGATSRDVARAETVLGLSPFATLAVIGPHHEVMFDGRFELTRFVDEDRATFDPDASVRTRSVLFDRFTEIATVARVSQRGADENLLTDDVFRFDADREETWELGITPSLESTLGGRYRVRGEYRFATIRSSDEDQIGSDTHAIASRLDAVLDQRGTFAFFATDGAQIRFENGNSGRTASTGVGIGRPFGRTMLGAVTTGRDWVRVNESSETLEDTFWAAALRWEPNERLLATLGYGERVFGRRPSASLRLSGRRSSVEFRWSRELSLAGDAVRDDAFSAPFDTDGVNVSLAEPEEGVIDADAALSPFAENASRVRERIDIGYTLNGRRSRLTASTSWIDDENLNGSDETVPPDSSDGSGNEIMLGFGRTLSSRTDLSSRYRFLTTRTDGAEASTRSNILELVISVRL